MATYIMLTRIDPAALQDPQAYLTLNEKVARRIERECPEVTWVSNYAVLGPYDYLDVFEAPSQEVASRVAVIVRSAGHATTEIWGATSWEAFEQQLQAAVPDRVEEANRESFPASDPPAWTGTTATRDRNQ